MSPKATKVHAKIELAFVKTCTWMMRKNVEKKKYDANAITTLFQSTIVKEIAFTHATRLVYFLKRNQHVHWIYKCAIYTTDEFITWNIFNCWFWGCSFFHLDVNVTISVQIEHAQYSFPHNPLQWAQPTLSMDASIYPAELSSKIDACVGAALIKPAWHILM